MREAVDRENHKANVTPRNKDERTTARRGWLENSSPETTVEMSFVNRREFFVRGNGTHAVASLQKVLGNNVDGLRGEEAHRHEVGQFDAEFGEEMSGDHTRHCPESKASRIRGIRLAERPDAPHKRDATDALDQTADRAASTDGRNGVEAAPRPAERCRSATSPG